MKNLAPFSSDTVRALLADFRARYDAKDFANPDSFTVKETVSGYAVEFFFRSCGQLVSVRRDGFDLTETTRAALYALLIPDYS